jgi:hypothetical protein
VPLTAAAQHVVPVADSAAESLTKLRQWATGRCLSAAKAGVYQYSTRGAPRRRRLPHDPSDN